MALLRCADRSFQLFRIRGNHNTNINVLTLIDLQTLEWKLDKVMRYICMKIEDTLSRYMFGSDGVEERVRLKQHHLCRHPC